MPEQSYQQASERVVRVGSAPFRCELARVIIRTIHVPARFKVPTSSHPSHLKDATMPNRSFGLLVFSVILLAAVALAAQAADQPAAKSAATSPANTSPWQPAKPE